VELSEYQELLVKLDGELSGGSNDQCTEAVSSLDEFRHGKDKS